jgi:small subunit ribosomal protein S24e
MNMEIEIDSKKKNPLLNRTEVYFTIKHLGGGTPNRDLIRNELADKLNIKKENIIVNVLKTVFGISETTGYAKIYDSKKKCEQFERTYILKRNKLIKDKKEEEKPEEKKPSEPEIKTEGEIKDVVDNETDTEKDVKPEIPKEEKTENEKIQNPSKKEESSNKDKKE